MRLHDLQAARTVAREVINKIRSAGPITEEQVVRIVAAKHFSLQQHGLASASEFVEKYAPEIVVTEGRSGDTYFSLRTRTSEEGSGSSNPTTPRELGLSRLERLIEDAPRAGINYPEADAFVRLFEEALKEANPAIQPEEKPYSPTLARTERRFVAAACVRLIGASRAILDAHEGFRIDVIKLTDDVLDDLYRSLNIEVGQQTYVKLSALASAGSDAEATLVEAFQHFRTGEPNAIRQRIMRAMNSTTTKCLITPFVANGTLTQDVTALLASACDYLAAAPASKLSNYQGLQESLDEFQVAADSDTTELGRRIARGLADEVRMRAEQDYSASPLTRPAKISPYPSEKRYPFGERGAEVDLSFKVVNEAEGHAIDARITIEVDDTRLALVANERYLGQLKPNETVGGIEFSGEVAVPSKEPIPVLIAVTWRNGDGTEGTSEHIVELRSQQQDIPWSDLRFLDPYSLEPVSSERELVGRSELLDRLESKARAANVGSFWIFGQKRVGKTSLAKAFHSRLSESQDQEFVAVYLEAGDYVDPSPEETIRRLGKRICKELGRSHAAIAALEVPTFESALSPLTDYLQDASRAAPDLKFIFILDEFDELPIELFRRGGIGDAFFLTLRSISGKRQFGFLLVGGERMEFIMSAKGEALNKFAAVRVDYFDRATNWEDFQELLYRPIESLGFSISEGAVSVNHAASAGNPYFAKLIGAELFTEMVSKRDADVQSKEMQEAVDRAVRDAGVHRFQHFWEDGIFEVTGELKEERSVRRRQVLLALAEVIRSGRPASAQNIADAAAGYGLDGYGVNEELKDFERRQILKYQNSVYNVMVGLFERWLVEYGVRDIVTSLTDRQALLERKTRDEAARVKPEEVLQVAQRFGLYRGREISADHIRVWLNQFDTPEEQRLMFRVLEGTRYYSDVAVREKLRNGHDGIVIPELARRGAVRRERTGARKRHDNVLVSYIGTAGKSGQSYVRLYRDSNDIFVDRAVDPDKLPAAIVEKQGVRAVVIVDDFIGTGSQALEDLQPLLATIEGPLKQQEAIVIYLCVSGLAKAAEELEAKLEKAVTSTVLVRVIDPLDPSDGCFVDGSRLFPEEADRTRARAIAQRYGESLQKRQPLGFGGCQVAIAFEYSCPNNSLPILWAEKGDWVPIFPRH